MARGRSRLLRRWRRVPHELPLPAHAADVHVDPDGGPLPDHRHPRPDAADPRERAVGALPPQPRRADPGDGHRRGARLHVPGLHAGPERAHQPRHPAPPGPAAEQQPAPDRAHERAPLLAPGHAGHLLRGRDRDGRQHLPRRPQRRAHADAVERRPQRRLLARQPAAALPAGDRRPRVPLRVRQRRDAARQPALAARLDPAAHRAAQAAPGLRSRLARVPPPREPQGPRLHAQVPGRRAHRARRDDPGAGQPLALRAVRRARPLRLRGPAAGRDVRRRRVSPRGRAAVLPDTRPARLLLVHDAAAARPPRGVPAGQPDDLPELVVSGSWSELLLGPRGATWRLSCPATCRPGAGSAARHGGSRR